MLPADLVSVSALGIHSKASWGYTSEEMAVFTAELTLSQELLADSITAKVAMVDEEIAGYYTLRKHEDSGIELDYMFVAPEHFHRGIGTKLMIDAMAEARDWKARELTLIADPNAVGFYEKFGAKIIGRHVSSIPNRRIPIMSIELARTLRHISPGTER